MIDLRAISLRDLLPESIASDPVVLAMCDALDAEFQDVTKAIEEAIILPRIATQTDEEVLDAIARSMGFADLTLWDNATIKGKRDLLVNIFAIRRRSGTLWSVRRIFDLLELVATVVEWWEEAAPPYTYRVRVDASAIGVTLASLVQIPELLLRFTPARCQLTELAAEADSEGKLRLYPATTVGRHVTVAYGGP